MATEIYLSTFLISTVMDVSRLLGSNHCRTILVSLVFVTRAGTRVYPVAFNILHISAKDGLSFGVNASQSHSLEISGF